MTKSMKRIHSITLERIHDDNPDISYLDQIGFEQRKREYEGDHFDFIGIRADARILIPNSLPTSADYATADGTFTIQRISSGGLWGIESDSDAAYLKEIEEEQLSELREQLHVIGFSNRAISAAMRDLRREQ